MENEEKEIKSQKPEVKNLNNKEKSFSDSLLDWIIRIKPYIMTLKKHWKKLLTINFIVLIITLGYLLFLTKPYYKSSITILPNYGNKTSDIGQLSGLAAMTGLSLGKTDPMDIYNDLVTSESVLSDVIYAKYQTKEFSKPVNLIEYFELKPDKNLPEDLQKRKMFLTLSQSLSKGRV